MVRTRYNNVFIVSHQILKDRERSSFHIDITPVHPGVVRPECCTQEPVSGLGHQLSSAGLGRESVSTLDILVHLLPEVLFDDGDLAVWLFRVGISLEFL